MLFRSLDIVKRKIDTHDQAWFTRDVAGKPKFVVLTEPEDLADWKTYEVLTSSWNCNHDLAPRDEVAYPPRPLIHLLLGSNLP